MNVTDFSLAEVGLCMKLERKKDQILIGSLVEINSPFNCEGLS
jgi:hypothetical protein